MTKGIRYAIAGLFSLFFAGQAQAVCTGAGIYQSCVTTYGNNPTYSSPYSAQTQTKANAIRTFSKNAQTATGMTYNKAAFNTQLNSTKATTAANISQAVQQSKQTYQADTQTYQNIKNSHQNFTCDQNGCKAQ